MLRWSGRVAMVTGASAGIGAAIARELVLKGMKVVGLARRVKQIERWLGRVAMVTGASAGMGRAIAKELVINGMKVMGLAPEVAKIEAMKETLKGAPGQLHARPCDVTKEADVLAAFDWANKNLGGVDVMVNNAGILRDASLIGGPTSDWQDLLQVNVIGLSICTREAVKSMKARGVGGHIIHINSIAAHKVAATNGMAMYSASKHAVKALTEGLRVELLGYKPHIKITSISPGATKTDILVSAKIDASKQVTFQLEHFLAPEDIAAAALYVLGAPPHVQIHELTIKPIGEVF